MRAFGLPSLFVLLVLLTVCSSSLVFLFPSACRVSPLSLYVLLLVFARRARAIIPMISLFLVFMACCSREFVPPWFPVLAATDPSYVGPPAVSLAASVLSPIGRHAHPVTATLSSPSRSAASIVVGAAAAYCSVAAAVIAVPLFPSAPSVHSFVPPFASIPLRTHTCLVLSALPTPFV